MPKYVALGSSFAAGPGIDPILDPRCGRSGNNYAHLVAAELGFDLTDVTSSGATSRDVLSVSQQLMTGGTVPPQIEAVVADTDLVTVTVGGNDVDYVGTLLRCSYRVDPGGAPRGAGEFLGGTVDPGAVRVALDGVSTSLVGVVDAVRGRAPRARVVLVDYLTVLPLSGPGCSALPLEHGDLEFCREVQQRLEQATAEAARAAGADLVPASAAGREHSVCSAEPWVSGWEFGDLLAGGLVPYHPNAAGMRAVAGLLADLLSAAG